MSWRGEPLLHPDIFKMIRYAKEKRIKDVAFLTNLECLKDEGVRELVDSGADWFSVSIDGMEENYNKIRYPSKFNDIVRKIKMINELKEKLGRKKPAIRIQSIWSAIREDPFTYKEFWTPLVDKISFIADQKRFSGEGDYPVKENFKCQSPWLRMFIGWDGKVANCCEDFNETNILGDATKQPLKDIWNSPKYRALRTLDKQNKLTAVKLCAGCHKRGVMKEEVAVKGDQAIKFRVYVGQSYIKDPEVPEDEKSEIQVNK